MEDAISQAKASVQRGHDSILKKLDATPDDKLNWSPSSTSRSVLGIIAHCSLVNKGLAASISGNGPETMPSLEELDVLMKPAIDAITTRGEAIEMFEGSISTLMTVLDGLTPETMQKSGATPFGPMPIVQLIHIPAIHMVNHGGQIDYLQTVWGDMITYM